MMRDTSIWAYAWDLLDEGLENALDHISDRGGLSGVSVATIYHAGKFLHVHNPKRRVVYPVSGTLYYQPNRNWYGKLRIQPPVWPGVEQENFWPTLRSATTRRGMALTAWVLGLHNSGIGFAYPDCTVENAYGDRIPTDLCAFHPDVRAYLVAAISDIAATLECDRIVIESLQHMPFRHGYHHEVIGVPTGPTVDFLLSLDFSPACQQAAHQAGIDIISVRRWVRETLDAHFANPFGPTTELSWSELRTAVAGEFGAYLSLRQQILTSLLAEISAEVRRVTPARLALCDFGPLYSLSPDGRAWEDGVDLAAVIPLVDELHPTFYFTDMELHGRKVAQYAELLAGERPMLPAIRAILPQTGSYAALIEQLRPIAPFAAGCSFYNYGFMPLTTLDWIRRALTELDQEVKS